MLRHRRAFARALLVTADYIGLLAVFAIASGLRFGDGASARWNELLDGRLWLVSVYAAVVVVAWWLAGLYRFRSRWSFRTEARDILTSVAGVALITLAMLFAFKLEDVSRQFLVLFFGLLTLQLLGTRLLARQVFTAHLRSGRGRRHLLVVGSGLMAEGFVRRALKKPELGVHVTGFVNDDGYTDGSAPWLGGFDSLPDILAAQVVHEVVICLPLEQSRLIDAVVEACREQGKDVRIPVQFTGRSVARARVENLDDLPVLSIIHGPERWLHLLVKHAFDWVGALVLVVVTAPLQIAAAVAILVTDGRPILFKQTRGGHHGRTFELLKFRTMVRDAEQRRMALLHHNERMAPVFKMAADPRVTRVGKALRRWSIDELPQLFNVLKGDMSLVGPRPAIPDEIAVYDLWQRRRLSVRPGITGLWQVTARSEPDFARWMELDLQYIDNWSLWNDVKLLARTPGAMFRSPGE